ncbi:hypothetical protein ACFLT1_07165 [Bacteroidota bacterium]
MLSRILKNNSLSGVFILFCLAILLWFNLFFQKEAVNIVSGMPLFELFYSIVKNNSIALTIVSLAYIGFTGVMLNRLNFVHYLLEERSFMPAAFFFMLSASLLPTQSINPVFLCSPFIIISLVLLTRGDEHQADPMAIFKAGLIIGAGSFFYLKIIWFLPILWITAAIIRPISWRGILKPILILALLALFYFTYYWVLKDDLKSLTELLAQNLSFSNSFPGFDTKEWILSAYLTVLIIISSFYLLNSFQGKKIIIRKLYLVFFFLFLYSILFYVLISGFKTEALSISFIPLSYLFANYFNQKKRSWIREFLLWIWLLLLAYSKLNITLF